MTPPSYQQRYISFVLSITLLSILHGTRADSRLYYCGISWYDANQSCSVECPNGTDSECPSGQSCFADCTNCCPSEDGYGGKRFNYCGTSWSNANSMCGTTCPGGKDNECPAGQFCFAACYDCPQSCQGNYNYCGSSWFNANSFCGDSCINGSDDECPSGQSCFGDCYDCSVLSPSTPTAPTPTAPTPTVPTPTAPTPTAPTPTPPTPTAPTPTAPTPTNPTPSPPSTSSSLHDSRLIAYLGNWQPCPSIDQVKSYTHIKIAFAVTYDWFPSGVVCSPTCEIATPLVCNNAPNSNLIQTWQDMGIKVSVSFGGASMGGSWAGSVATCWEDCYGRETQVVSRLVEIVDEMGLDGVDIDYEYFYDDNQNNSGFSRGAEAKKFLKDVTIGLRQSLPSDAEISHAPMDVDLVPGKGYYDVMKETASYVDFLNPQYYNGITRPGVDGIDGTGSGSVSALSHYTTIVNDIYNGDATKVVFGFCIADCGGTGSNINGNQAAQIMTDLASHYDCNGGAFFWVINDDTNGSWSETLSSVIAPNQGCSDDTVTPTAPTPTAPTPTPPTPTAPTPTAPTPTNPTPSPPTCVDSTYRFRTTHPSTGKRMFKNCVWAATKSTNFRCTFDGVSSICPDTCARCDTCVDSSTRMRFLKDGKRITRDCGWTAVKPNSRCKIDGMKLACRQTCNNC